ncbi:hypothetical protein QQP08_015649 [Theobroma cacao]|nr:hypothetical protein QQP08_015649 [Theobroma cacao]
MMYFDFLIYEFHTAYKSPALFFIPPTGISICLIPTNSDHKKLNPTQLCKWYVYHARILLSSGR